MTPIRGDGGAGDDRHRILRALQRELTRHPAVRNVVSDPPDAASELRATVDPAWFGRDADQATVRLTWVPDPTPGPMDGWQRSSVRAYYTLHYSETGGFDGGFHCHPNDHVEGLLHYQERIGQGEQYAYEPATLDARSPASALWELLDKLAARLEA